MHTWYWIQDTRAVPRGSLPGYHIEVWWGVGWEGGPAAAPDYTARGTDSDQMFARGSVLGSPNKQEAGVQPVLASGLLQVSAWPGKQAGCCGWTVLIPSFWLGCWRGTGQATGSRVSSVGKLRLSLLPPPWASGSGFTQEAAPVQSRLALRVWFILFCLCSS